MTVSYQYDVASSASGGFIRLLFRWRGSVWKVVYRDMLIFLVAYVLLTVLYQFALTESQQRIFEKIVYFCSTFMDLIPLSFMLGFYVSFIAARWWSQFIAIPWPDKLMNIVAMYIPGLDEASRVVRRTLMRYLNLSLVLVLRSISMAVKRRFPTKEHLVEAGFMTKTELEMFQSVPSTEFNTFWIPCTWFINVLREARQECRITDSNGLKLIMEELNEFRSKCGLLWGYDWISIPLVYTQVVTMATYAYFVACMFGRQNVSSSTEPQLRGHRYDYYIPIFTIFQLMFYMGLLKVAEQLINPFGDDDEDFELNWIIDRHMKVSYLGVDTLNGTPPPLVKDTYYNELDVKIPYTEASRSYKKKTYRGSVAYMQVPMEQQGMVLPDVSEGSDDDGETVSEGMGPRRPSQYTLFHSKGVNKASPSSSFTNLDNASLDSEWKCSLPNLANDAKNASGSLGYTPAAPMAMDMLKAEDDEIVLQEVVIDPKRPHEVTIAKAESLQIPGVMPGSIQEKKSSSLLSVIKDMSPKIAPKFPREKLKSMFRKRKMSTAMPFFKVIKGVRFTKDTKENDDSSDSDSLLAQRPDEDIEVEITISDPELTEMEKTMGVHPYYVQQKTASPEKLARAFTSFSVKEAKDRRGSHDGLPESLDSGSQPTRCSSLPNIQEVPVLAVARVSVVPPLCKPLGHRKEKSRRPKKKRKSPPPPVSIRIDDDVLTTEKEQASDASDSSSRRNTLPQITLTRYDQKSPEHLDLATPVSSSGRSSDGQSLESVQVPHAPKSAPRIPPKATSIKKPPEPDSGQPFSGSVEPKPETCPQSEKVHSVPPYQPKHSPKPSRTSPSSASSQPPSARLKTPSPTKPKTVGQQQKPKTGLSLTTKTSKSPGVSPGSESAPCSPTHAIPTVSRTPSFPKLSEKIPSGTHRHPSPSDGRKTKWDPTQHPPEAQEEPDISPTGMMTRPSDLQATRSGQNNQSKPQHDPPPVPLPRRGSRGKK